MQPRVTGLFLKSLRATLVFAPSAATAYLLFLGSPDLTHPHYITHGLAILIALALSAAVGVTALANYKASGDRYQLWIGIGYLAFATIYAPHGILAHLTTTRMPTFLIFGPASRAAVAVYMLMAAHAIDSNGDHKVEHRRTNVFKHSLAHLSVVGMLVALGLSGSLSTLSVRMLEGLSFILFVAVLVLLQRHPDQYLLRYHRVALILFLQASFAFLASSAWSHLWWFAHVLSAAGFLVLGYAIVVAYERSGSFTAFFSEAQLADQLQEKAREQEQLAAFNQAALDAVPAPTTVVSLPGGEVRSANRAWRHFTAKYGIEPGRSDSVEVLGLDVSNIEEALLAKVAESDGGVAVRYQCELEGEPHWFDLRAEPLDTTWELAVLSHWDITSEVRAQRKLERAATEKNELIATVSHELRTPLTAVLGIATLLNEDLGDEDRTDLLSHLEEQAAEAVAMIEDLLVGTQVEVGQIKVRLETIDVADTLAHLRIAKGSVSVEGAATPIFANADPARVRQIVRNLVSNADRYGGETVELSISSQRERVLVRVSDNGSGIPESDAEAVFEPYQRAAGVVRSDSVGLGLTVSRKLARLMNGDLRYRRENGRTVFELELEASEPTG